MKKLVPAMLGLLIALATTGFALRADKPKDEPANPCARLWSEQKCEADTSGQCTWDAVEYRCELIGGNQDRCLKYKTQSLCTNSVWNYCVWDETIQVCHQQ
jgi:hypothetical protein